MPPRGGSAFLQIGAWFFAHHCWSNRGGRSRVVPGSGSATNPPPCQRWRAVGRSLPSPEHPHRWLGATGWKPQQSRAAHQRRPTTATHCCQLPNTGCGTHCCPGLEHPPALVGCWCHRPSWLLCEMAAAWLEGLGRKGLFQGLGKQKEGTAGYSRGYSRVQQKVALKKPLLKYPFKQNKAGDAAGSLPQEERRF